MFLCSSLFFYLKLLYIICALLFVFSSLVPTYIRVPPNFHLGVLLKYKHQLSNHCLCLGSSRVSHGVLQGQDEPCEDLPTARCLPRGHSGRDRDGYSHSLGSHTKDANKMERVCYNRTVGATEQRCECAPRDTRYAEPAARVLSFTRGKQGTRCYYRKLCQKKKKTGNVVILGRLVAKKEENR